MTIAAILKDRDGSVVAVHGGDTLRDVIAQVSEIPGVVDIELFNPRDGL